MSFRPRRKTAVKKTEYQNVYTAEFCDNRGISYGIKFQASLMIKGQKYHSLLYDTAREAALWVDKKLIEHKLEPRNILKAKA